MFDFHNRADETEPNDVLIEKHFEMIRHVHLNDMDGGHPKRGDRSYCAAFAKLRELGYERWVSLEIFTMPVDPSAVLGETMDCLKDIESVLGEAS